MFKEKEHRHEHEEEEGGVVERVRERRYCSLSTFNAICRRVYKRGTNEPCQQDNATSSLLHAREILD